MRSNLSPDQARWGNSLDSRLTSQGAALQSILAQQQGIGAASLNASNVEVYTQRLSETMPPLFWERAQIPNASPQILFSHKFQWRPNTSVMLIFAEVNYVTLVPNQSGVMGSYLSGWLSLTATEDNRPTGEGTTVPIYKYRESDQANTTNRFLGNLNTTLAFTHTQHRAGGNEDRALAYAVNLTLEATPASLSQVLDTRNGTTTGLLRFTALQF